MHQTRAKLATDTLMSRAPETEMNNYFVHLQLASYKIVKCYNASVKRNQRVNMGCITGISSICADIMQMADLK